MNLLQRRRELLKMGGVDPYADWVKIEMNLTADRTGVNVVDVYTGRVPDAALAAIRMMVDGVEITPVRQVDLLMGTHEILYYINNGEGTTNGWWYWVQYVTRITFPETYTTLTSTAIVLAISSNAEMVFRCPHPPFAAGGTFANYIKGRNIYVVDGYQSEYAAFGFTNIHTLGEL